MSFLGTGDMTIDVFAIFGMIAIGILVLRLLRSILKVVWFFFMPGCSEINLLETYGRWAVVTGSTDGIGKAYAHEFAKKGLNIILISRTLQKLQEVAQEISDTHKVQTEIIQADYSNGRQIYDTIGQNLAGKDIGILVNNVGVLAVPKKFEALTEDEIWNQLIVNTASVPAMSRLVIPGMLDRKRGLIVNIASSAAVWPMPYFQVYAATKAFVRSLSLALEYEYRWTGIDVQTILPGAVSTNMNAWSDKMHKGVGIPSPTKFVDYAVFTIGYARETTGYWIHEIQLMFMNAMPHWVSFKFAKYLKPQEP